MYFCPASSEVFLAAQVTCGSSPRPEWFIWFGRRAAETLLECSLGRDSHPNKIKSWFQRREDFEKWSGISRMRGLALVKLELLNFLIIISWGGGIYFLWSWWKRVINITGWVQYKTAPWKPSLLSHLLTLPWAPSAIFVLPSSPAASSPSVHISLPPPDPQSMYLWHVRSYEGLPEAFSSSPLQTGGLF